MASTLGLGSSRDVQHAVANYLNALGATPEEISPETCVKALGGKGFTADEIRDAFEDVSSAWSNFAGGAPRETSLALPAKGDSSWNAARMEVDLYRSAKLSEKEHDDLSGALDALKDTGLLDPAPRAPTAAEILDGMKFKAMQIPSPLVVQLTLLDIEASKAFDGIMADPKNREKAVVVLAAAMQQGDFGADRLAQVLVALQKQESVGDLGLAAFLAQGYNKATAPSLKDLKTSKGLQETVDTLVQIEARLPAPVSFEKRMSVAEGFAYLKENLPASVGKAIGKSGPAQKALEQLLARPDVTPQLLAQALSNGAAYSDGYGPVDLLQDCGVILSKFPKVEGLGQSLRGIKGQSWQNDHGFTYELQATADLVRSGEKLVSMGGNDNDHHKIDLVIEGAVIQMKTKASTLKGRADKEKIVDHKVRTVEDYLIKSAKMARDHLEDDSLAYIVVMSELPKNVDTLRLAKDHNIHFKTIPTKLLD